MNKKGKIMFKTEEKDLLLDKQAGADLLKKVREEFPPSSIMNDIINNKE